MTIVLNGDKNVVSLLPPEDARQVLLALFSEADDLPEMTPLANMAYISICKGGRAPDSTPGGHEWRQLSFNNIRPHTKPGAAGSHGETENNSDLQARRFSEFWAAYPRKVGKEAARKSWRRIKPSETLLVKILSAIDKAKNSSQWQNDNGQYIPNPATWLNQGRWDDELPLGINSRQRRTSGIMGNFIQREYDPAYLDSFVINDLW